MLTKSSMDGLLPRYRFVVSLLSGLLYVVSPPPSTFHASIVGSRHGAIAPLA